MLDKNEFIKKTKHVRLVAIDVDGVLTDGFIYFSMDGNEIKRFSFRDIMGISQLRKNQKVVALISGEKSRITDLLEGKIKIDEVYQGIKDKRAVIEELKRKYELRTEEICYMGDDINDVDAMLGVGLPVSVPNGHKDARDAAVYVTENAGGDGAVREIVDMILGRI